MATESELERVEGGYGVTPRQHFFSLYKLLPGLRGLAILDNDNKGKQDETIESLQLVYWRRYEAENYFITPDVLLAFTHEALPEQEPATLEVLKALIQEKVFSGSAADFSTYQSADPAAARLIWQAKTERLKLSGFTEEFFARLSEATATPLLMTKGEFHRLVAFADPAQLALEVGQKLDLLLAVFQG